MNRKYSFSPPLLPPFPSFLSLPPLILIPTESKTPPLSKICAQALDDVLLEDTSSAYAPPAPPVFLMVRALQNLRSTCFA
jgi:hypothetical protein